MKKLVLIAMALALCLVGSVVQAREPIEEPSDNATGTVQLEVNVVQPSPPRTTGGGGPIWSHVYTDFCGTQGKFYINWDGRIIYALTASCEGGALTITIQRHTIAKDDRNRPIKFLTIEEDTSPPPPPTDKNIIGIPFILKPSGATFKPPLTFTWTYDPDELPEGVAPEDLVIAFWDGEKWVEYPCVVDTEKHTVTALVDHFTTFALLSPAPKVEAPPPPPLPPKPVPPEPEKPVPPPPEKPEPVPTPPTEPEEVLVPEVPPSFLWLWIVIGIGVVVAIVCYVLLKRRRRRVY